MTRFQCACGRVQTGSPRMNGAARSGALTCVTVVDDSPPPALAADSPASGAQTATPRHGQHADQSTRVAVDGCDAATTADSANAQDECPVLEQDGSVASSWHAPPTACSPGAADNRRYQPGAVAATTRAASLPGPVALGSVGELAQLGTAREESLTTGASSSRARPAAPFGSVRLASTPSTSQVVSCCIRVRLGGTFGNHDQADVPKTACVRCHRPAVAC